MKHILIFAFLLCSVSALAQYPAQPTTKQELGRQTTGDGLIFRGSGSPAYTPVNNRNAWIYYDTLNNRLFRNRGGAWALMIKDTSATNEIQMPYIANDTLYLTQNITGEPLTRYVNRVWPIAALSDTSSITGEQMGDVAFVTGGTAVAFRGSTYWSPFSGGSSFSGFNIAGDSGSSAVASGGTVTVAGGYGVNTAETGGTVTVTADTIQLATQNDISSLPSGTGANLRIPVWTGSASLGSSTLLQSATGQTLDANLAFRITGGTTASRPTGAAGMLYWNTSNSWFDFHNGTSWFNPARSSTANGIFTAGSVLFATSTGAIHQDNAAFFFDDTNNRLGLGTTTPIFTVSAVANNTDTGMGAFAHSATATQRSVFALLRSRGTSSTPTTVVANDLIGSFTGNGHDGTSYQTTARIDFAVSGTVSTNTVPQRITFTTGTTEANRTERMTVMHDGNVGVGTLTPDRLFHSELSGSATNSVGIPLRLTHITSGAATSGFGAGLEFETESAGGTNRVAGTIENPYTTATNAAEVSDLVFRTMRAGTLTESLRSLGNGTLQIGTLSGTASKIGAFTSGNIATVVTPTITAGGTTGNRTINELAGTVNIAAAGTTVTVTNSLVTASSLVFCTLRTNDATATVKNVVPAAGSFTINLGAAATSEVSIGFFVVN